MAYVHTDRLGSVVNLSDQYGRVTARADYTDWGEVRKYTDITVDGGFRRLLPEITYAPTSMSMSEPVLRKGENVRCGEQAV